LATEYETIHSERLHFSTTTGLKENQKVQVLQHVNDNRLA